MSSYEQLFWIRVTAGIGLGCLLPPTFSIIADLFGPEERGRANGLLGSVGFVGIIIGVLLFLCWFGYYVTYPKDAARLREAMAARRQMLSD